MNSKARNEAWLVDQYDPDNWLRIPEFGVLPRDVSFDGFAFPVVTPKSKHYGERLLIRALLRTVRRLVQQQHQSQSAAHQLWLAVLQRIDQSEKSNTLSVSTEEASAAYYSICMTSLANADRWISGGTIKVSTTLFLNEVRFVSEVIAQWVDIQRLGASLALEKTIRNMREAASQRGRIAADIRHSKEGGARAKRDAIRAIWATGKHANRDLCAEQECAGLEMSFAAARKALRNMPNSR